MIMEAWSSSQPIWTIFNDSSQDVEALSGWLFIDYSLRNLKTQINLKVSISMRSFFHCTQFRHQNADKISIWLQPQFVLIKPYDEPPTFPWNFASKQVFQANLTSYYKTLKLRISVGWPYVMMSCNGWKDKLQSCVFKILDSDFTVKKEKLSFMKIWFC